MLGSITRLGERGRQNRFSVTAGSFIAASTAGGAAMGGLLGMMGTVVGRGFDPPLAWVLAAAAVVAFVAAMGESGRIRLPNVRRQVDETWLDQYRGWVYGTGFGFQLGLGVVTVMTGAGVHATVALCLFSGVATDTAVAGLVIGTVFGLARGATILAAARAGDRRSLAGLHQRLDAAARPVRRVAVATHVAMFVVLALSAISATGG